MNYLVKFNGYLNRVLLFFSGLPVLPTGIAATMFLRVPSLPIPGLTS